MAECHYLSVVILSVIMLNVTYKTFMLSVVMLSVAMLNIVAPQLALGERRMDKTPAQTIEGTT